MGSTKKQQGRTKLKIEERNVETRFCCRFRKANDRNRMSGNMNAGDMRARGSKYTMCATFLKCGRVSSVHKHSYFHSYFAYLSPLPAIIHKYTSRKEKKAQMEPENTQREQHAHNTHPQ